MNRIRVFENQVERVETGVVRFGDDWPGVFIRGDNALAYAMYIHRFLEHPEDLIAKANLEGLARLLIGCDARSSAPSELPPEPSPELKAEREFGDADINKTVARWQDVVEEHSGNQPEAAENVD